MKDLGRRSREASVRLVVKLELNVESRKMDGIREAIDGFYLSCQILIEVGVAEIQRGRRNGIFIEGSRRSKRSRSVGRSGRKAEDESLVDGQRISWKRRGMSCLSFGGSGQKHH